MAVELDHTRAKMRALQERVYELEAQTHKPFFTEQAELIAQRDEALEQATNFREDVRYLTAEVDNLMKDFKMETELRRKAEEELRRIIEENRFFKQALDMSQMDFDKDVLQKIHEMKEREKVDLRTTLAIEAAEKLKANQQL